MFRVLQNAALLIGLSTCWAATHASEISDAELSAQFTVSGMVVSGDNRIAIINEQLARVGEQIGAAEIIAIESNLVHLRVADRTFAMKVGSALIRNSEFADAPAVAPQLQRDDVRIAELKSITPTLRTRLSLRNVTGNVTGNVFGDDETSAHKPLSSIALHWEVVQGDTLSGIAASLSSEAGEQRALMASMFADNPQAFGGSMDLLYAGARLALPTAADIAATATGAKPGQPAVDTPARSPDGSAQMATVAPGDTLSGIATRYLTDSITLNQLMLAIYEANPNSFGGNLNLLYAFEIIEVPEPSTWQRYSPAAALAAVSRHAAEWRAANEHETIQHNVDLPERIAMHRSADAH